MLGGVPERLIGAVLKTVERASVPWVRIPPPPNFKKSLKRLFLVRFWHVFKLKNEQILQKKGTKKGLLKNFVDFGEFPQLSKTQYYTSVLQ